jgi:hypothetical protein
MLGFVSARANGILDAELLCVLGVQPQTRELASTCG